MSLDLKGRTILVTRPADVGRSLVRSLEEAGARVFHHPAIRIEWPDEAPGLDAALERVAAAGPRARLLLSSRNGLQGLLRLVDSRDRELLPRRAFCVGPSTAQAARDAGFEAAVVAHRGGMAELVRLVLEDDPPADLHLLWPRGNLADEAGPSALMVAGATLDEAIVYRTVDVYATGGPPSAAVLDLVDTVVFASPSAVENLRASIDVERWRDLAARLTGIAIGETTGAALLRCGFKRVRVQEAALAFDEKVYA